jgi:hypothetical protein
MKHAGNEALGRLIDLLDQIRTKAGLKEKKLGIFYRKSNAFLHFHEDPAGIFADLKIGEKFARYPVNTERERMALLSKIDRALKP